MTLLVIDLHTPANEAIHNEHELWRTLVALGAAVGGVADEPDDTGHLLGGTTDAAELPGALAPQPGVDSHGVSVHGNHDSILDAPARKFPSYRLAVGVYWLNILLIGVVLYLSWDCAINLGLAKSEMPCEVPTGIKRRIVVAQALYAFGAALCVFNTHYSIAFIALVQLNYAVAPRLWRNFKWTQPLD
jgi:hypothetical protein